MSTSPNPLLPAGESQARLESDSEFHTQAAELPARWHDARRYPRFPFQAPIEATIYPLEENATQTAVQCSMLTRDLSRGGINLIHCEQLFPGQKIDIVLNGATRCAEVVWCRRLTNRCYSTGCRFVKLRDDQDEPREHPHYPFHTQVDATIFPPPDREDQPPTHQPLVTLEVSRGGINVIHTDKLFVGQHIQMMLRGIKQCVEVVVVWCHRLASRCYSAGCRFIARK
jgi:hypothetical protein